MSPERTLGPENLANLNLQNLDQLTRERLNTPIVKLLYEEYAKRGLLEMSLGILKQVPEELRPPLVYTLATHVTKEKPVFIHAASYSSSIDKENARFVASAVDILWMLSLVVDDIVDKDAQRANRPSAWKVFGQEQSMQAAKACLGVILKEVSARFSPETSQRLYNYINQGLESLKAPELSSLETSVEQLNANIDQRAKFHCEFPAYVLFNQGDSDKEQAMSNGLYSVNRAGQILNDVKDLVSEDLSGRPQFSDIRNRTLTIPLRMLWNLLLPSEKEVITTVFGKNNLSDGDIVSLDTLLSHKLPKEKIEVVVRNTYQQFLAEFKVICPVEDYFLLESWVNYKFEQGKKLLS